MHIDSYRFGHIVIDGKSYSNDVVLYPGGIYSDWFRREGHRLGFEDIRAWMKPGVHTLIVGTGYAGMIRILPDLQESCSKSGVQLIAKRTAEAIKLYNEADQGSSVGAFHLTC